MKRIYVAACVWLVILVGAFPAHAQKTKAQMNTEINANFADNNIGNITAALLRATMLDTVASYVDYLVSGDATMVGGNLILNTVNANVGTFGGPSSIPVLTLDGKGRITAASVAVPSTLSAWGNTRLAKTAAYTPVTNDCGSTVALGGSAFYALTFTAASGYDPRCIFVVTNEDTGRAKRMTINGLTSFLLWPGQQILVFNSNNVWKTNGPYRWYLSGNVSLNVDASLGSDTNDGLATGAGAFASVSAAVNSIANNYDLAGNFSATVNVPGAVSMDASHVVAVAGPFVGATGPNAAAQVVIDLNNTGVLTTTSTAAAISATFGGNIQVQNGTITIGSGGTGTICHFGGQMTLLNMTFGVTAAATASNAIFVSDNSFLYATGTNVTFSAGLYSSAVVLTLNNSTAIFEASTVAVTGNVTDQYFVFAQGNSVQQWSNGTTITLSGGVTVTGTRYQIADGGSLQTGSGTGSQTFFPGTVAGITRGYGRYDTNEPNIPMAFASLGACNAATEGQTASVTDSNTAVFRAVINNGGANHVLAYCNGVAWTVAG